TTGATTATVALGEAARVQLLPGTRARIVSGSQLGLTEGRVRLSVARGPFTVRAGAVTLEVVGTVFEVASDATGVRLMVSEGVVRATRGGQTWEVKAGETWPAPEVVQVPEPELPVVAPPPAPSPEQQAVHQSRLEQAQALTRAGKLDAARALYVQLAKENAPIAELALYHLAHLEAVRARRPKLALEALDEQLRRFPNGALAPEAKLSRIEALRALGFDSGSP
ncbi:MAG: FecR domain-containing protein, partial [Myxococcaceae bacterium]|nr:FecR domain-containing protein [Myxococcaceae bacterium]